MCPGQRSEPCIPHPGLLYVLVQPRGAVAEDLEIALAVVALGRGITPPGPATVLSHENRETLSNPGDGGGQARALSEETVLSEPRMSPHSIGRALARSVRSWQRSLPAWHDGESQPSPPPRACAERALCQVPLASARRSMPTAMSTAPQWRRPSSGFGLLGHSAVPLRRVWFSLRDAGPPAHLPRRPRNREGLGLLRHGDRPHVVLGTAQSLLRRFRAEQRP